MTSSEKAFTQLLLGALFSHLKRLSLVKCKINREQPTLNKIWNKDLKLPEILH